MAAHSLVLHRMQASLAFTGRHEDASALGQDTARALRDLLPAAIGRALEPALGSSEGVLRIDYVALRLRLGRAEASAAGLADRLAGVIAREVAAYAGACGTAPRLATGVAYWPSPAAHAAAYIASRLRLAAAPAWAFPDFRALGHLSAAGAAVELIADRPEILAALAHHLGPAASAFAATLPEPNSADLLTRLLALVDPMPPSAAAGALSQILAALQGGIPSAPARAALTAAMVVLADHPATDAAGVRAIALLARLAVALSAVAAATEAASDRPPTAPDLTPSALALLLPAIRPFVQDALAPLADSPGARATLANAVARARRPRRAQPPPSTAAPAPATSRAIPSRIAGIGLLLPAVLDHAASLTPAALHRALAASLGPDAESAARLDPVLAALVPFDPGEPPPTFPSVPDRLRAAVPETGRDGPAMGEGAAAWGACLAHGFAARLTGFEASSLAYLRHQFLARPGTLHFAERRMTLALAPLPLGILLRLCGLHRWSAALPCANGTVLRIEIADSAA